MLQNLKQNILRLKLFLTLALLSACSVLPTPPSLQSYLLPNYTDTTQTGHYQTTKSSLRINQPYTSHFLSTTRIVQSQGNELAVYKGARWADPTPILFRNRVLEEFRNDGRIKALSSDDDHLQADYELNGDLLAFQGISSPQEGNKVFIRFHAKLTRTSDKSIITSQIFEVNQLINGRNMDEVIRAFGLANDQLNTQLLNWTIQNIH